MVVSREELEAHIERLRAEIGDPRAGIYGPGSQAWVISKEAILFLGGGRAALLQTAHPFVARGVAQHSATQADPFGRFRRTFEHVFAMIFGDLDAALRSARRVHRIHSKIDGQIAERTGRFEAGTPYQANDEEALFWVHSTLIETAVQIYELVVRKLSYAEKNQYYRETRRFAYLFGIPERVMPENWAAFEDYNHRMWSSNTLAVGSEALRLRRFLFAPPTPLYAPLFYWIEQMTAGLMPARLREAYQLPWAPLDQLVFRASARSLASVYPYLPQRIRYLPAYISAQRRLKGLNAPDRVGAWLEAMLLFGLSAGKNRPWNAGSAGRSKRRLGQLNFRSPVVGFR